jgi:hypothetical protein
MKLISMTTKANSDFTLILDSNVAAKYATHYATKKEPQGPQMQVVH